MVVFFRGNGRGKCFLFTAARTTMRGISRKATNCSRVCHYTTRTRAGRNSSGWSSRHLPAYAKNRTFLPASLNTNTHTHTHKQLGLVRQRRIAFSTSRRRGWKKAGSDNRWVVIEPPDKHSVSLHTLCIIIIGNAARERDSV